MSIPDRQVGIRAQDVQTGLQDVQLKGSAAGVLDNTRLIGMAARLALHLRGTEVLNLGESEDYQRFLGSVSHLGIDSMHLPQVLNALTDVGFVEQAATRHGRVTKIVENVPYFSDLYEKMGGYWKSQSPTEVELASVELLERLSLAPAPQSRVMDELGLSNDDFELVKSIGVTGGYFKAYESPDDEEVVLLSPIFWEEKPEVLFALLKKYPAEEIAAAILNVRVQQGYPIPEARSGQIKSADQIILDAIAYGLLPCPAVTSSKGKRYFAYTPYTGGGLLLPTEKAVLQKARAILSCVRYGQHFGAITRIRWPRLILEKLKTRKEIGPHSEIGMQYATLVVAPTKVGRIERVTGKTGTYMFKLIETRENIRALDLAVDMLEVGEAITERVYDEQARGLLLSGSFQEPLTTLSEAVSKKELILSEAAYKRAIEKLVDYAREGEW